MIYLAGSTATPPDKNLTLQALGLKGRIYCARAGLLILVDDVVTLSNMNEFEDNPLAPA